MGKVWITDEKKDGIHLWKVRPTFDTSCAEWVCNSDDDYNLINSSIAKFLVGDDSTLDQCGIVELNISINSGTICTNKEGVNTICPKIDLLLL